MSVRLPSRPSLAPLRVTWPCSPPSARSAGGKLPLHHDQHDRHHEPDPRPLSRGRQLREKSPGLTHCAWGWAAWNLFSLVLPFSRLQRRPMCVSQMSAASLAPREPTATVGTRGGRWPPRAARPIEKSRGKQVSHSPQNLHVTPVSRLRSQDPFNSLLLSASQKPYQILPYAVAWLHPNSTIGKTRAVPRTHAPIFLRFQFFGPRLQPRIGIARG